MVTFPVALCVFQMMVTGVWSLRCMCVLDSGTAMQSRNMCVFLNVIRGLWSWRHMCVHDGGDRSECYYCSLTWLANVKLDCC